MRATGSVVATRDLIGNPTSLSPHSPSNGAAGIASEPTGELVRRALDETKELVRLELALAREELKSDIRRLQVAAILGGVAVVFILLTLSTLVLALVLAVGATPLGALLVSLGLAVIGGALAAAAYANMPRVPLERTRARLKSDVHRLGEHLT